jgi:NADPH:quinone reductase
VLGGGKPGGAYTEYVCRHTSFVARKPRNLSFAQAAAVPAAGLTAYQCLERVKLQPGEPLFVAGGSGGVGTMVIQLARHAGAGPIFTTAGSERSARYLMGALGIAREQILFHAGLSREQLEQRLRDQNGGHLFRVAIDCVGGAMTGLCCDIVDFEGHVISIVQGPRDASRRRKTTRTGCSTALQHSILCCCPRGGCLAAPPPLWQLPQLVLRNSVDSYHWVMLSVGLE